MSGLVELSFQGFIVIVGLELVGFVYCIWVLCF